MVSYFRRNVPFIRKVPVLFKTRLIFPRINGPTMTFEISARGRSCFLWSVHFLGFFLAACSKVFLKASLSLMKEQVSRLAKSAVVPYVAVFRLILFPSRLKFLRRSWNFCRYFLINSERYTCTIRSAHKSVFWKCRSISSAAYYQQRRKNKKRTRIWRDDPLSS